MRQSISAQANSRSNLRTRALSIFALMLALLLMLSLVPGGSHSLLAQNAGDGDGEKEQPTDDPTEDDDEAESVEDKSVEEILKQAWRLEQYGALHKALQLLLKARRAHPTSIAILHAIARLYRDTALANPEEARLLYQRILQINPNNVDANYFLALDLYIQFMGMLYDPSKSPEVLQERLADMRRNLLRAIKAKPDHAKALDLLAASYAIKHTAQSENAPQIARKYFKLAVQAAPNDPEILQQALYHFANTGDPDDAAYAIEISVMLEAEIGISASNSIFKAQAALFTQPARFLLRRDALREVVEDSPTTDSQLALSLAQRCLEMIEAAELADADNLDALKERCLRWMLLLEKAYRADATDHRLAICRPYSPDRDPASIPEEYAEDFAILPEFSFYNASIWYDRAQLYRGGPNKDAELAAKYADAAMRNIKTCEGLERRIPDILNIRANLHLWLNQFDAALEDFTLLQELEPDHPRAYLYINNMDAFRKGEVFQQVFERFILHVFELDMRLQDRIEELKRQAAVVPNFVPVRIYLGRLLLQAGLPHEAQVHYEHVLENYPDHPAALLGGANANLRVGNLKKARELLERLKEKHPESDMGDTPLAQLERVEADELDGEALRLYQRASSESLPAFDRIRLLEQALELSPTYLEAQLAIVPLQIGEYDEAIRENRVERAQIIIRQLGDYAERAVKHATNNRELAKAWGNLAQVRARMRDEHGTADAFSRARDAYLALEERSEEDDQLLAEVSYHLAFTNHLIGRWLPSYQALKKCFELGLDHRAFQSDEEALIRAKDLGWRAVRGASSPPLRLGNGLQKGERYEFDGLVRSTISRSESESATASFNLEVEILDTPDVSGRYKVKASLRAGESAEGEGIGLPEGGLQFTLEISPWFGLISQETDSEVESQETALLILRALVESFTLRHGNAPIAWPYAWNYPLPDIGVMQLPRVSRQEDAAPQAIFLNSFDDTTIEIARVQIADFREADEFGVPREYPPRKLLDAYAVYDGEAGAAPYAPREFGVSVEQRYLVDLDGDRREDDVETRIISVAMKRKSQ